MRWNPPSERTQMILLSPVLAVVIPAAVVMLGPPLAVMYLRDRFGPTKKTGWQRWYAWRPVKVEGFFYDQPDKWVWLEWVEQLHGSYRLAEWNKR